MFKVVCSPDVALTGADGSGVRRVRIFKGQPRERLIAIGREPVFFAPPLPKEIEDDPHLIVEEVPSPRAPAIAGAEIVDVDLSTMEWPHLVELAKKLEINPVGKKKELLRALCAEEIKKNAEIPPEAVIGTPDGAGDTAEATG